MFIMTMYGWIILLTGPLDKTEDELEMLFLKFEAHLHRFVGISYVSFCLSVCPSSTSS